MTKSVTKDLIKSVGFEECEKLEQGWIIEGKKF